MRLVQSLSWRSEAAPPHRQAHHVPDQVKKAVGGGCLGQSEKVAKVVVADCWPLARSRNRRCTRSPDHRSSTILNDQLPGSCGRAKGQS